ncbi:MAG: DUF4411 family protein [Chloroflexota bacterium]|nr:DUF4411 family protein [Chloroflexota bacterium]
MKKYCFDTSGLTNPLQHMPEDLHEGMWKQVRAFIEFGQVAVTTEIYEELIRVPGALGNCIRSNKQHLVLEVGDDAWDWKAYVMHSNEIVTSYQGFISEYNGNIKGTVGMNDVSIIALAKSLDISVVSMESPILVPGNQSQTKRRIPDICGSEKILHLTFNDFLRREQILS